MTASTVSISAYVEPRATKRRISRLNAPAGAASASAASASPRRTAAAVRDGVARVGRRARKRLHARARNASVKTTRVSAYRLRRCCFPIFDAIADPMEDGAEHPARGDVRVERTREGARARNSSWH